jgi:signal peptidase
VTILDDRPTTVTAALDPAVGGRGKPKRRRAGAHVRTGRSKPEPTARRHAGRPKPAPSHRRPAPKGAKGAVLRRVRRAFGSVATVLAVLAALVAVVAALSSHETAPGEYEVFGHPVMSVLSGSMTPAIRTGDLVIDNPVSPSQAGHLKVGQIISFRAGSKVFTHRIHAVEHVHGQVAYQTKGDANNAPDRPLVPPPAVIGVFSARVPDGGYVLSAVHTPTVLAFLLAAPMLWLLSTWLFGRAREAERGRAEAPASGEAAR